jgi:ribosomal protein L3
MMGHFARAGVPPKQKLKEFRVSKNAVLPVGTRIYVQHFKAGQFVDVRAKTFVSRFILSFCFEISNHCFHLRKGKGFAGAM